MPNRATTAAVLSCALASPALLAQAEPVAGLSERLRGTWSCEESGQLFRFDGERCVVAHGLQQTLMGVRYDDANGKIYRHLLGQPGREIEAGIEFADATRLTLAGKQRALALVRIAGPEDAPPEAVVTDAMPLGRRAVGADELAALRAELAQRRAREQGVRRELSEAQRAARERLQREGGGGNPFDAPEVQDVLSRMKGIDDANTRWLRGLLADVGWIDAARFGDDANRAAFLIVQHCGNVAMLRAVLAAMKAEFDAGHAPSGPRYALMYDRLALSLGGKQRYGSQLRGGPDGAMHFPRLEDPAGVDARRASVGLGSLAEYAGRFAEDGEVTLPEGYPGRDDR